MDNVTHTLFALTLARTPLGRAGRGTTAALVIASNAPDIDIVTTVGGAASYLRWHRGPTHGPIGAIVLGVITGAVVWAGRRWVDRDAAPERNAKAPFHVLVALSMLGVLFHVLMDLPTSYGTRLLSPFDWHWHAFDWLPIIDIYLLVVLAAGLLFGRTSAAARRRNASIALMLMAANYGLRAVSHHQALTVAPRLLGPTLPPPCDPHGAGGSLIDRWPRPQAPAAATPNGGRCLVEIAAIPTFSSPFRWRIIAQMSNAYEVQEIDLLDERFRAREHDDGATWQLSRWFPNQWTADVDKAASVDVAQTFLGFSRFPRVRWSVDPGGITVVRWTDMRFVVNPTGIERPGRPRSAFTAFVSLAPDGRVLDAALGQ